MIFIDMSRTVGQMLKEKSIVHSDFFLQDKDFNYIKILTEVWVCEVFICLVHVFRYWKDKIFPSAKYITGEGHEMICPGDQKMELYELLQAAFRSPTEETYEVKLLSGLAHI